jgi:hypothetical protein
MFRRRTGKVKRKGSRRSKAGIFPARFSKE